MATWDVFSEEELARLRGFPEITRAELIRYFTLTESDETFVRRFRGPANVLGASVQLCTLPWLGFVPDDVRAAPAVAVASASGATSCGGGWVVRLCGAGTDPNRSLARGPAIRQAVPGHPLHHLPSRCARRRTPRHGSVETPRKS